MKKVCISFLALAIILLSVIGATLPQTGAEKNKE